ncbi:MAG: hypothetical protein ISR58_04830 [Anaerolineales bacterium]|nr:hypothetical protein [Chloroflexota bacterium]MBL6980496.1 hypothetical protein [Anaerolineales bacterium]
MKSNEWNATLTGDYLWSNVNFGEAVTEAMTPLSWSVILFTLDDWIFLPGYPTVGNIGGYPYLNISIMATLFNALGQKRDQVLRNLEGTLYMRLPDEMEIPLIPKSRLEILRSLPNLIRLQGKQKKGVKLLNDYLETNPAWFQHTHARLQETESKSDLLALWAEEIKPHVKQGVWIVLGTVNQATEYTMRLRRELEELVGADNANTLIANLSDDSGMLASLGPVVGLSKVSTGEMSRESYLENYGHRGPHEFELSAPRPVEDPAWIDQVLAQIAENPTDTAELLKKQRAAYEVALQGLARQHARKAKSIQRKIGESARRARLRERSRSEYVRDRWMMRLFALRAGELTSLGEEIFFLYLNEVLDLLTGDKTALENIPQRKEIYQQFKSLPPYPSVIRGQFDPFEWAADPNRRSDIFDASHKFAKTESKLIKGSPGSAGQVAGIARCAFTPEQGAQLQPGEILVTVQTDISWTMIFPRAAAVITDIGAPLSHAAIVARELGIPAVVGCGDATMRIKTGDRLRVDGGAGVVDILEPK